MSAENGGSGEEGQSRGCSTDEVFVYNSVGVDDGLDDLDGTPQEAEEHRQWP